MPKDILYADETVVTLFLAVFSVGIGIGSLLCNHLLKGKVTGSYAAPAALGMAFFTLLLYGVTVIFQPTQTESLQSITSFFQYIPQWGILFSLLMVSVCGGVYIVPLYTLMQARTAPQECARIIAANNILNALFMVLSALFTLALLSLHWTVTEVFLLTGLINIPIAFLVHKIVRIEQAKRKEQQNA